MKAGYIGWLVLVILMFTSCNTSPVYEYVFQDPEQDIEVRLDDLLEQMTIEEKISQMMNQADSIPRLGIPKYNWWNECLHGVARNGIATVFPQAIGLAATWDTVLIKRMADVIALEARAKHHENTRKGDREIYQGLTFWSPNINLFRDPRWGRGMETYGEDPHLTSRIAKAFITGLQGDHPTYFKVIATPKHYIVHSGPESLRHEFNAIVSQRDFFEYYAPVFESSIREAKAYSIMGAYNRTNDQACCTSRFLLTELLRDQWGFEGYVVSDCGGIWDLYNGHEMYPSAVEASAAAVKAGCDLTCGNEYAALTKSLEQGLLSETDINRSVRRLFKARIKLGMFDPPEMVPFANVPFSENDKPEHDSLALVVAQKSIVLLKNDDLLPLKKESGRILVIGPKANDTEVLLGNYKGGPSNPVSILNGLKNQFEDSFEIVYKQGFPCLENIAEDEDFSLDLSTSDFQGFDYCVFVGGITPKLEGEQLQLEIDGFYGGDRTHMQLPDLQQKALKLCHESGVPTVLVLLNGSALAVNYANDHIAAIIEAWYPGQQGGTAVADVIKGSYNPAGRLPVTFYKSVTDLPYFEDYSIDGRTYRYFDGEVLFPFGHGLSFSQFTYDDVRIEQSVLFAEDILNLEFMVENDSDYEGDEVVQVYISKEDSEYFRPIKMLVAFNRIHFRAGERKLIKMPIKINAISYFDEAEAKYKVEPGVYDIQIGGSSEDIQLRKRITIQN